MLKKRKAGQIWLIEVPSDRQVKAYNRLIGIMEKSPKSAAGKQFSGQTIALHSGNPFLKIRVPENGAVLSAFARTAASRRALLDRALSGGPVKQADLTLSPE